MRGMFIGLVMIILLQTLTITVLMSIELDGINGHIGDVKREIISNCTAKINK